MVNRKVNRGQINESGQSPEKEEENRFLILCALNVLVPDRPNPTRKCNMHA